ncbi:MAG: primosomal protein N' [Alphaproteobacteria bacterium]|nr:primosomal protein N' [Alphaproteobacteria bacterium]
MTETQIIHILLALPIERTYPYAVSQPAPPGTWVEVQAGKQKTFGVVWDKPLNADAVNVADGLKSVDQILPAPPLPKPEREFLNFAAQYTLTPPGKLLRAFAPVPKALRETAETNAEKRGAVNVPEAQASTLSTEQNQIARKLIQNHGKGFSTTLLQGVTGAGKGEVYIEAARDILNQGKQALVLLPEISLSSDWQHRIQQRLGLKPAVWHSSITPAKRKNTWLNTISGKTPLVIGARSALFLPMPELGLVIVDEEHDSSYKQEDSIIYSARDLAVARARAHNTPCVLVSATPSLETLVNAERGKYQHLNLPRRHKSLANSKPPVISAVDLRQDRPQPISAAPSMSPQVKAAPSLSSSESATPLMSPSENAAPLMSPPVKAAPSLSSAGNAAPLMSSRKKTDAETSFLSPTLVRAIAQRLKQNEQSLLFLNRRGYAPLVLCSSCGHRLQCPHCSGWMVLHSQNTALLCHHCGLRRKLPRECVACQKSDRWVVCGPGVERIAREVGLRFPEARVAVVSSDTVAASAEIEELFARVRNNELDILVGTQILGKGHHFPAMTLVGIVDADIGLAGGDLRALEKSWQLLTQVAGRARGQNNGEGQNGGGANGEAVANVLVQTRLPQHPVMRALAEGDAESFIAAERAARLAAQMPPFGRLAALILSSADAAALEKHGRALADAADSVKARLGGEFAAVRVFGPAPAPIAFLRRRHRHRLLVRAPLKVRIQDFVRPWVAEVRCPSAVRRVVDIDPYSFL